jgi:branched-chain amino acid transport system substrate-binding protein
LKAAGIKMLATGDITDETYIDAIGDSAIGIVTTGIYSSIHDSPVNKKFAADYVAVNGKSPRVGWVSIAAWDAMQLIYDGLAAQAGSKFDPDKFMGHIRGRTIESPRGPITIDKVNNDIIQDVYIRRVEKIDGVLQNVEIESFRAEAAK